MTQIQESIISYQMMNETLFSPVESYSILTSNMDKINIW